MKVIKFKPWQPYVHVAGIKPKDNEEWFILNDSICIADYAIQKMIDSKPR